MCSLGLTAFTCWALDKWGPLVPPGPLVLSLLLSLLALKLSEAALVGSFLTHTYFTLWAKVLQK